jgi:hypothetical protein
LAYWFVRGILDGEGGGGRDSQRWGRRWRGSKAGRCASWCGIASPPPPPYIRTSTSTHGVRARTHAHARAHTHTDGTVCPVLCTAFSQRLPAGLKLPPSHPTPTFTDWSHYCTTRSIFFCLTPSVLPSPSLSSVSCYPFPPPSLPPSLPASFSSLPLLAPLASHELNTVDVTHVTRP